MEIGNAFGVMVGFGGNNPLFDIGKALL